MKNRNRMFLITGLLIAGLSIGLAINGLQAELANAATVQASTEDALYVCAMHPWEVSHEKGESCSICNMALSEVEGYKAGDPIPTEDELFVDPDSPMKISVMQHEGWIPIKESPFYQEREGDAGMDHSGGGHSSMDHGSMNHDSMDHSKMEMQDELFVCAMHPWEFSHEKGESCTICNMALTKVEGYKAGDPMPKEDELFVDPADPMKVSVTQHNGWIPIKQSPYYQPKSSDDSGHEGHGGHGHDSESGQDHSMQSRSTQESTASADSGTLWTCGMHPDVIEDEPGTCPICQMDLVTLKRSGGPTTTGGARKIKYWVAPMDPTFISDEPGKSPMGMDLVPVYEDEVSGGSTVSIDPVTLQNIGVVSVPAKRTDLFRTIRSNGTVEIAEENEVKVNSRISGWVEKLYVGRTGDPVRKGQPLLEIYSPELVAAQEEFILALQNGEALSASGIPHVSQGGRELIKAARRRLQLWNVADSDIDRLEQTREVRRTLPVYSPSRGIVMHKNVVEGTAVKAGMDLFTITDLGKVWVKAQVYEYELPWIKENDVVIVTSSYDPDLELTGYIDYIYPTLDPRSRTAEARIVFDNPGLILRPDMYVDVRIQSQPIMGVVAVPKSAVIRSGVRDLIFVKIDEGLFEPREVQLGLETDDSYEITNNLDAGEEVVISAQFLLDSEATLQEAIERRIAKRRALSQPASAEVAAANPQAGH
ncbi:cation efflux system protein CusB precursor [bacterium BMS3Bbin04]|nr:cation efflux system protein CusB precursor [bacterium BMS3Bbin04]